MWRQVLMLSLYERSSRRKFLHEIMKQSEKVVGKTENVYDLKDTLLLFLDFTSYKCKCHKKYSDLNISHVSPNTNGVNY